MNPEHDPERTWRCATAAIRARRAQLCWTQKDLAQQAGIGVRTISRIEAGQPVSHKVVHDVAAALECSIEDLLQPTRLHARHNLPALVRGHQRRRSALTHIHRVLAPRQRAAGDSARSCALTGLGGIGKSQLALSYAWEHLDDYQSVLWIDASNDLTLAASSLAPVLDAPERTDPRQQVVAMQALLREGGPHLVILDGVSHPHAWRSWLLDRSEVRLLVTSRLPLRGTPALAVGPLAPDDAIELLTGSAPLAPRERAVARELCEELGYLTLALAVAPDVVDGGRPLQALLREVRQDRIDWSDTIDPAELSFDKNPSLSSLFQSTWNDLMMDPTGRLAAAMLRVLGAGADAPLDNARLADAATRLVDDPPDSELALTRLLGASLARRERGGLSIHRLLRSWLEHHITEADHHAYRDAITDHVADTPSDTTAVLAMRPLRPHLEAVAASLTQASDSRAFIVALRLSELRWQLGMYAEAEAGCREALATCPSGAPRTILRLELAQQLVFLRRVDEAAALVRESLPLHETLHGATSDEMAKTYQVLGNACFIRDVDQKGDFTEAMSAYQSQLDILRGRFGDTDIRTSVGHMTVGQVHLATGQPHKALEHIELAATAAMATYGPHHLETCNARFLVGQVRHDLGEPDGLATMEESYATFCAIMGDDHPQGTLMAQRLHQRRQSDPAS